jgi:competence protein ComEA
VLVIAGLAGAWFGVPHDDPPPVEIARQPSQTDAEQESITVHVAGAVHRPGLVTVDPGDRVAHAIAAAGGALGTADLARLNLAGTVRDGDQVIVPLRGDAIGSGSTPAGIDDGLVDVNTASVADLEALPGVGPVLAQRIFDYREEHGRFTTIEDLLDVPGIGEGKLATLREAAILR